MWYWSAEGVFSLWRFFLFLLCADSLFEQLANVRARLVTHIPDKRQVSPATATLMARNLSSPQRKYDHVRHVIGLRLLHENVIVTHLQQLRVSG